MLFNLLRFLMIVALKWTFGRSLRTLSDSWPSSQGPRSPRRLGMLWSPSLSNPCHRFGSVMLPMPCCAMLNPNLWSWCYRGKCWRRVAVFSL